jgi:hypothetical protein
MRSVVSSLSRFVPIVVVLTLLLAFDAPGLVPKPHGQKPMFPVLSRLEMIAEPDLGGVARIVASITAWIPGEDLAWRLEVPAGLEVVMGPTSWNGRLARGETRSFEIGVRVPDGAPHELTAVVLASERPKFRSAATLPLDLGGLEGPKGTARIVSGDGVEYIQYQGTVQPR